VATHPLEAYLKHMLRIHAVGEGTDETAYYGAIEALFNEAGKDLRPKVRCVLQLKNRGAGHPDGGLFSRDQWQDLDDDDPMGNQMPSRGVLEVKGLAEGTAVTIASRQVADYWGRYRKVIVTNYREFVLDYLKRIILIGARIAAPQDLAWLLCAQWATLSPPSCARRGMRRRIRNAARD